MPALRLCICGPGRRPGHFGEIGFRGGINYMFLVFLDLHHERSTFMIIQVNTDSNISGRESLGDSVRETVEGALIHVSENITRVEVHLSDVNGTKSGGDDIKCVMEARLEGRTPVAVTHHATNLDQSVEGAADKLSRLIQNTLEKLRDESRHRTDPIPPGANVEAG